MNDANGPNLAGSLNISRRGLFRLGLVGSAGLALGGALLGRQPTVLRRPSQPLRALDIEGYSILAAIADCVGPGDGALPTATELGVAHKIDVLMAGRHPQDVEDFGRALRVVENAFVGFVLDGRWKSFTSSDQAGQNEILTNFMRSRFSLRRSIYRAIRGLCAAAYWSDSRVQSFAGYPGPPEFGSGQGTTPSRPPITRRPVEWPKPGLGEASQSETTDEW